MARKPTLKPKRPLSERIADAEARSSNALGNYNEAVETGRRIHGVSAEQWLDRSQRWLDRANDLRGWSD